MVDNSYKYTCIFGGGAIRGVSYVGALKALDEMGIVSDTIAGSSVGAIIAGMRSVGYTPEEMKDIFENVNYDLFRDIHFGLGKTFALSKGEVFLDWIREIIEKKFYGNDYQKGKNPTVKFKDIDKNLVIITTDLTNFSCKEFSKFETPDFEIATAIRISSSMPGLMTSINFEGSELVDGDLQKSWPLWKLSKNLCSTDERILEFRLEGDYDSNGKNAIDYLNTVYSCVTSIATKSIVENYGNRDKYDYITINTGEVLIVDFNLPKEKREDLMKIGYKQTIEHFKTFLPNKKEKLIKYYSNIRNGIKKVVKELSTYNVQQAKVELGLIYMELCETKDVIDKKYYEKLQSAKFRFLNELKPSRLFRKYSYAKIRSINEDFKQIEKSLKNRIDELKKYNENFLIK